MIYKSINSYIIIFIITLAFFSKSVAQDTINLNSGKQIACKVIELGNDYVLYEKLNKDTSKHKMKVVYNEKVFSIKYQKGNELVIYKQDTVNENYLTEQQMRNFVAGERAAIKYYKTPWLNTGAIVSGAGGAVLHHYWGLIVPFVYTISVTIKNPVPIAKHIPVDMLDNVYYIDGYKTIASRKKLLHSIEASLIAFLSVNIYAVADRKY